MWATHPPSCIFPWWLFNNRRKYTGAGESDLTAQCTELQVAAALLGPGAYLSYCAGNTALPGCGYQALHIDSPSPWPTAEDAAAASEAYPARHAVGGRIATFVHAAPFVRWILHYGVR